MSKQSIQTEHLSIPENIGREIVESAALFSCPLLRTDKFVAFCRARELRVDKSRLLRLERLGLFAPLFRVNKPDKNAKPFRIPIRKDENWFNTGWAWDATQVPSRHSIPSDKDKEQEAYYSIFQIGWLRSVLDGLSFSVEADAYINEKDTLSEAWAEKVRFQLDFSLSSLESARKHTHQRAIGFLCQYLSNRYYARALGDQRSIRVVNSSSWDEWIEVGDHRWDSEEEVRRWDPKRVELLFDLTPERLKKAYESCSWEQRLRDPLANWYPLVQFVSIDERRRLKGTALFAETMREGALMLRSLHLDLYNEQLPPPDEVHTTVITHIPELEVRKDVRRYLEFVVNDYGLNPQPKLVLFLEGQSEERVINKLFDEYIGFPAGKACIEIVVVRGVGNATGSKKDGYGAILGLIDYLHHHQTLTFIILDNENNVKDLQNAASKRHSVYGYRNRITRPDYIRVWRRSFEFDNFSDTEIASALSQAAEGKHRFNSKEIAACRKSRLPGAELALLFHNRTGSPVRKEILGDILAATMLAATSRKAIGNRPIVKALERVVALAVNNPFPVMDHIWRANQASKVLAKKR